MEAVYATAAAKGRDEELEVLRGDVPMVLHDERSGNFQCGNSPVREQYLVVSAADTNELVG